MAKTKVGHLGSLRIISGNWRGRKLNFFEAEGLRPTGDRIRETLFNWLQFHLAGARCLDLFAGSGALGFEAASRGADVVDMVEVDSDVFRQLQQNAALLQAQSCQLHLMHAEQFLQIAHGPFQVVFIDPPFSLDCWNNINRQLINSDLLSDGARIYLEMPADNESFIIPEQWHLLKEKRAGEVRYYLFEHLTGVEVA